jgi:hypothetical protein
MQSCWQRRIAFAHEAQVHRKGIRRLHHAFNIPWPRRAGRGKRACGRPRAAAQHGGDAAAQGFFNLLWRYEVNMCIHTTRRDDVTFAADDFCARANDDVHARLGIRVARFTNRHDATTFEADIRFDNAPMIHDEGVRQHGVYSSLRTCSLALCHAIPNGFTTAEFDFFTIAASS